MKVCPKCRSEVDDNFDVCWNCNYSFSEDKTVKFEDENCEVNIENQEVAQKHLDCLRCKTKMEYSGNYEFHEGTNIGFLGNLFELFMNKESFDIYVCPNCGKVEFFVPNQS